LGTKRKNKSSWIDFQKKHRLSGNSLFSSHHRYHNAVFVAGCQRSGTTLVSRIIRSSDDFYDPTPAGIDDELYSAKVLVEEIELPPDHRYCFQTTYLNEFYKEYLDLLDDQKLIWLIRNPHSVIYSMLYNWKTYALNELFIGCGLNEVPIKSKYDIVNSSLHFYPKLEKACYSYIGKINQLKFLIQEIPDKIQVYDYDYLILNKETRLKQMYSFIDSVYNPAYANLISPKNMNKKNKLSEKEVRLIDDLCMPEYEAAKGLIK
jgi:hypothetical protein